MWQLRLCHSAADLLWLSTLLRCGLVHIKWKFRTRWGLQASCCLWMENAFPSDETQEWSVHIVFCACTSNPLGLDYAHHTLSVVVRTSRTKWSDASTLMCSLCINQKNNEAHRVYLLSGLQTLSSHCTLVLFFLLFSLTLRYCRLPDTHPFHFLSHSLFSGHLVPLVDSAYTLNFRLACLKPLRIYQS